MRHFLERTKDLRKTVTTSRRRNPTEGCREILLKGEWNHSCVRRESTSAYSNTTTQGRHPGVQRSRTNSRWLLFERLLGGKVTVFSENLIINLLWLMITLVKKKCWKNMINCETFRSDCKKLYMKMFNRLSNKNLLSVCALNRKEVIWYQDKN